MSYQVRSGSHGPILAEVETTKQQEEVAYVPVCLSIYRHTRHMPASLWNHETQGSAGSGQATAHRDTAGRTDGTALHHSGDGF